jgi:hypothetical protein
MRQILRIATLAASAYSASACRAPAEQTQSARTAQPDERIASGLVHPTACSLLRQEEMSRLLGGAVAPPKPDERGSSTSCTYTPAAGKGISPYAQITINWNGGDAAMSGMRLADKMMSKDAGFSIVDKIEGVGDEASMMIGGLMTVRKGELFMTIDLRMQPRAKEKGIAIAQAVLARTGEVAR